MVILMRKNYVKTRNFREQLSLYDQIKLFLMKKSLLLNKNDKKLQIFSTIFSQIS